MQEQFLIRRRGDFDSEASTLALLLGSDYFAFAIHNTDDNALAELKRYNIQRINSQKLNVVLQNNEVLGERFGKIVTAFDFNTNTLLPVELNNGDNSPLLYLNGAGQQDHIMSEVIGDWNIANVYSVPYGLLNWAVSHFPSSHFWHAQTVHIKNTPGSQEGGSLNVDFTERDFNVTAVNSGKLLISKNYSYKAPADVLFYLLKICEAFDLKQNEVRLNLSGLIDRNSGLFKMLFDYFLNIDLVPASWEQSDDFPPHYFTLLNQISLCGS